MLLITPNQTLISKNRRNFMQAQYGFKHTDSVRLAGKTELNNNSGKSVTGE